MMDFESINAVVETALARVGVSLVSPEWKKEPSIYGSYYTRKADWYGMQVTIEILVDTSLKVIRVYTSEYLNPSNCGRPIYQFNARGELASLSIAHTHTITNRYGE